VSCRYGIGQIYYRQEKYEMAINNFKHALAINPRSAVLMCYVGMAYLKQGDTNSAMKALRDAIATDELNPLARYEFASVLISLERYSEAIDELEKLKVCQPLLCACEGFWCVPRIEVA
jgi:anaphase-promoting complex subunit 3